MYPATELPDSQRAPKEQDIALLRSNLVSIKKEMAAGTPIDPQLVKDLERRIVKLEKHQEIR